MKEGKKAPGHYIEKLAKYGDPSKFELPVGLLRSSNADMSFTGLSTMIKSKVNNNFKLYSFL